MKVKIKRSHNVSATTERLLMKVLAYIEKEPTRLNMNQWGNIIPKDTKEIEGVDCQMQPAPPCNTAACLAGTCLLTSKAGIDFLEQENYFKDKKPLVKRCTVVFPHDTPDIAKKILRITEDQANNLFYFKGWAKGDQVGWPEKYARMYRAAKTPKERFLATKLRVLHFIEKGK